MRKSLFPVFLAIAVAVPVAATKTQPKPAQLSGEAIVRTIGNNIAVLLDTNGDQAIDQGFLLSSDLPVSSTSARCPEARVEYTTSYVRLTYAEKVYDLYVAGYPEPPALKSPKETTKYVGYALQHSTGGSGCSVERALDDAGACYGYGK